MLVLSKELFVKSTRDGVGLAAGLSEKTTANVTSGLVHKGRAFLQWQKSALQHILNLVKKYQRLSKVQIIVFLL